MFIKVFPVKNTDSEVNFGVCQGLSAAPGGADRNMRAGVFCSLTTGGSTMSQTKRTNTKLTGTHNTAFPFFSVCWHANVFAGLSFS